MKTESDEKRFVHKDLKYHIECFSQKHLATQEDLRSRKSELILHRYSKFQPKVKRELNPEYNSENPYDAILSRSKLIGLD